MQRLDIRSHKTNTPSFITSIPSSFTEEAPPLSTKLASRGHHPAAAETKAFQFCQKCQRNQYLYTRTLADFDTIDDPLHHEYRTRAKQYVEWKKDAELRYPQVCADCAPEAQKQIIQAQKLARQDYMRKQVEEPKFRELTGETEFTVLGAVLLIARILWFGGIAGQLVWNLASFFRSTPLYGFILESLLSMDAVESIADLTTSRTWAWRSLMMSLIACWYSPHYKNAHNGFWTAVQGFKEYYTRSFSLLGFRILFYFILTSRTLSRAIPEATQAAHIAELFVVTVMTMSTSRAIKKDNMKLFDTEPTDFPVVGPSGLVCNDSTEYITKMNLERASTKPSKQRAEALPHMKKYGNCRNLPDFRATPHHEPPDRSHGAQRCQIPLSANHQLSHTGPEQSFYVCPQGNQPAHSTFTKKVNTQQPEPLFRQNTCSQSRQFLQPLHTQQPKGIEDLDFLSASFGRLGAQQAQHIADRKTQQSIFDKNPRATKSASNNSTTIGQTQPGTSQASGVEDMDMDWEPELSQKIYNFRPREAHDAETSYQMPDCTSEPPRSSYNPFRSRVPPAPITPAHRARNPPPEAVTRTPSREVKQNFFNDVTTQSHSTLFGGEDRHEMNMAQQKFFFQSPGHELYDDLANSFISTNFFGQSTLKPEAGEDSGSNVSGLKTGGSSRTSHLALAIVFLAALIGNLRMQEVLDEMWGLTLAMIGFCLIHGVVYVRSTGDGNIPSRDQRLIFGSGEVIAAVYMMHPLLVKSEGRASFMTTRSTLFGTMMLFEGWLGFIGA